MGLLQLLFSFSFLLIIGNCQSACPEGFERHDNNCYKAVDAKATWIEAKMYCRVFGSDLAIIESQAEEKLIEGMLTKLHGASHPLPIEGYWVDGTDLLAEGQWRWMGPNGQSRQISGYTNFKTGEPNGADLESCLHLYYNYGLKWNDYQCDQKQRFICKSVLAVDQIIG